MSFWWVNHKQTFRQEFEGGYVWCPKRKRNGSRNHFYETLREVRKDDIIFSYANAAVQGFGIATLHCYSCPRPDEFGRVGQNWDERGWRADVQFRPFLAPVRMVDFRADLPRLLPAKYAPIQKSGFGNQGAYFSKIHEELARFVLQKGYPELVDSLVGFASEEPASVSDLGLPIVSDWEDRVQKSIESSLIEETTRSALVHARRGQGLFRKKVLEFERQCRVTTVDNPSHLVASHIKPWRESSNEERLSAGNGLMLTPSVDHLFDRGFISFEDSGELIVSSNVDRVSLRKMAVDPEVRPNVGKFNQDQKHFLNYHREEVLLRALC